MCYIGELLWHSIHSMQRGWVSDSHWSSWSIWFNLSLQCYCFHPSAFELAESSWSGIVVVFLHLPYKKYSLTEMFKPISPSTCITEEWSLGNWGSMASSFNLSFTIVTITILSAWRRVNFNFSFSSIFVDYFTAQYWLRYSDTCFSKMVTAFEPTLIRDFA